MESLRIAIIGYGKMGKAIAETAVARGHHVAVKITRQNMEALSAEGLKNVDVAVEVTGPQSAPGNIMKLIDLGLPVVCGSTGWNAEKPEVEAYCDAHQGTLLTAGNFSPGVNMVLELNERLAQLAGDHYIPLIRETHHTQKLDAPSGTAILFAEGIIANTDLTGWSLEETPGKIHIEALRKDPAPGTHEIIWTSEVEEISLKHEAFNRKGFALGAVLAAEFVAGKKGIFNMRDVLRNTV